MEKAQYNKATLKLLNRNKADLLRAEMTILQAMAIDYHQGEETVPFVTQKLFEISDTILLIDDQIMKCREAIKKSL